MATKVKPSRINITGTAQVGQTPVYVDEDCFQWGDIPTDNCQLANGCGYQFTSCMVCDFVSPNNTTYPTTEAVCCYVGQKVAGAYKYKGTVADYEDLPTTGLSEGDVYNITNEHTTAPEFPAGANVAWTGSSWDVLGGVFDLSCKQDVLTAGPNITLSGATISGDFNYAEPTSSATSTTKCVCIPEITQLCTGQRIVVKPTITATNCATNIQLNNFTAYPVRYNNAALTSTTDGYVRGADQLTEFVFDGSYWHVVSKSYDANTTYTMNYSVDAGKYKAGSGNYAISRYVLAMEKDNGTWEKLTDTSANYSTGTSKGVNTNGFKLGHIRYYGTTTVVANGALIATNAMYNKAASVDLRYSTNCGGVTNWGEGDYIYIVGTMGNDGLFYLDTTTRWTNKLPTTNDGKLYIRIGICLAAGGYTCSFLDYRPIYYYDNGIKEYKVADNKQDTLVSGTNIKTINGCDVLGSGDLCIAGGVSSVNGQTGAVCLTIPTDNCELANGCGYTTCTGTVSSCADIISELGYTPYNSTNPCGYTTCTGTVTATDLQCYVQCCDVSGYQLICNMVCDLTGADNTHYPTAKAVADAIQGAGGGDMMKSTYDPCNCNDDAFDYCNFHNTPTIPTDNCQLANGCGYTTCTGTLSSCADVISALGYTPYNVSNPCGYINNFAGVISALGYTPYNNTNPCGYTSCTGTLSTCSDITTALGYTPYSNANPCGYTTCTGTVIASDLNPYVKGCDVACINGCCLTTGGDICIEGGGGVVPMEILLVGGGGGGGCGSNRLGGGGGGGGVLHLKDLNFPLGGDVCVKIGNGGGAHTEGCPTTFGCLGVYGGGNGGGKSGCSTIDERGGCGANGGGAPGDCRSTDSVGCYGTPLCYNPLSKGYCGGGTCKTNGGGGGGAGGDGCTSGVGSCCYNAAGGCGYCSDITGEEYYYGTGGSGGTDCFITPGGGVGNGGNATGYGGGGAGGNTGGEGYQGIAVVRYLTACGDFNGGIKYCCDGYTIHQFIYDGCFGSNAPSIDFIGDFLLIGGGGGGAGACGSMSCYQRSSGGGGGGGGVVQCKGYQLTKGSYNVVIGAGGCGFHYTDGLDSSDGGDSCFNGFIAKGGGGGGLSNYLVSGCCNGRSGANGGGGGASGGCGGTGTDGCDGGNSANQYYSGGGGGVCGVGGSGTSSGCIKGGLGITSDIEGESKGYAGGGAGGTCYSVKTVAVCGGGRNAANECDATNYGGGGGGMNIGSNTTVNGGNGCQGVLIISYMSGMFNVTGGDCCYECNGKCIHIFTQDGTLTVS